MIQGGSQDQDRFATVNGVCLCYRISGRQNAPVMILIAGLGMQLVEWPESLLENLRQSYCVVQLDNRDMGLSERLGRSYSALPEGFHWTRPHGATAPYHLKDMALDALALADHLNVGRFSVIGFSMGGMIAQQMSILAPERVIALASLCSADGCPVANGSDENTDMLTRFFVPPKDRAGQEQLFCESAAFYSHGAEAADAPATQAAARVLLDRLDEGGGDAGGYMRQALAITDSPCWDHELSKVLAPAFVAHGAEDPCLPVALGHRAADRLPRAELHIYENTGHWISARCVADLCAWLEKTELMHPEVAV